MRKHRIGAVFSRKLSARTLDVTFQLSSAYLRASRMRSEQPLAVVISHVRNVSVEPSPLIGWILESGFHSIVFGVFPGYIQSYKTGDLRQPVHPHSSSSPPP